MSRVYTYSLTSETEGASAKLGHKWCAMIRPCVSLVVTQIAPLERYADQLQAGAQLIAMLQPEPGLPPPSDGSGEPELGGEPQRRELLGFIGQAAADIDGFWSSTFPTLTVAQDRAYAPPRAYLWYHEPIQTPCHPSGEMSAPGAGPFYCELDQTVYLDLPLAEELATVFGRIVVAQDIAHEVGHHVQGLLGMLGECTETPCLGDKLTSRDLENMADCFGGAWTRDAEDDQELGAGDVGMSLAQIALFLGETHVGAADPGRHGTTVQRVEWFLHGYNFGAEACLPA